MNQNLKYQEGGYAIIIHLDKTQKIRIGSLGVKEFKKGYYAYFGSAKGPGGFKRIKRHYNTSKSPEKDQNCHWHIDYLLNNQKARIEGFYYSKKVFECIEKQELKEIHDFGSSDCACNSHLVYQEERSALQRKIENILRKNKIKFEKENEGFMLS